MNPRSRTFDRVQIRATGNSSVARDRLRPGGPCSPWTRLPAIPEHAGTSLSRLSGKSFDATRPARRSRRRSRRRPPSHGRPKTTLFTCGLLLATRKASSGKLADRREGQADPCLLSRPRDGPSFEPLTTFRGLAAPRAGNRGYSADPTGL